MLAKSTISSLVAMMILISPTKAAKINAVCRDISGARVDGTPEGPKFDEDSLKEVTWSYIGDETTHRGILMLQSSKAAGGTPKSETTTVQKMQSGHWTFLSVLPDALWVHSIFPKTGELLVSQNTSTYLGGASGKMMVGHCQVRIGP